MNIAIAHDILTTLEGSERVLLTLAELYPQAPIYTAAFNPARLPALDASRVHPSFLDRWPLLKRYRQLLIPLTPLAFTTFNFQDYDLVISNTSFAAKGLKVKPGALHICYCHTPTRYLWNSDIDPRARGGLLALPKALLRQWLKAWDLKASQRPHFFLANSNYVKDRIEKTYQRPAITIYPPVDTDFFCPDSASPVGDYFLFVSRLVKHKKGDLVIETFNRLGLPLKIIGRGPEKSGWQARAKGNIEFLGHLSDQQLRQYYRGARAFIFAAEEDFGIVPVEAMACGRPVIAYGAGGALETVIPGLSGLHFAEQAPGSLVQAVEHFITQENNFDNSAIRRWAEHFSTQTFQTKIKTTIDNLLAEHQSKS